MHIVIMTAPRKRVVLQLLTCVFTGGSESIDIPVPQQHAAVVQESSAAVVLNVSLHKQNKTLAGAWLVKHFSGDAAAIAALGARGNRNRNTSTMPIMHQVDAKRMPREYRAHATRDARRMPCGASSAPTSMPEGILGYSLPSGRRCLYDASLKGVRVHSAHKGP